MAPYPQFDSNILPNCSEYVSYRFDSSNLKFSQYVLPTSNDNKYDSLIPYASLPCINDVGFLSKSAL